jgi:thioredoxin reductase
MNTGSTETHMTNDDAYDVVVVGGGPAGLTGALVLARARLRVLLVDAGSPRNETSPGVHGFLTRDGMSPADFLAIGRAEVERYGVHVVNAEALSASSASDGFTVTLRGHPPVSARRLLVTTGLTDVLPDLPGLSDRWGRDVLHCTACQGWEHRDQTVAILGSSSMAADLALTWRHWTRRVILLRHTGEPPAPPMPMVLSASGITEIPGRVGALAVTDDRLTGVELDDGTFVPCDALVVQPVAAARSSLLESLGLPLAENASGTRIAAGRHGVTAVPGVWAAGNITDLGAQVVTAAAAGYTAASAIVLVHLTTEMTTRLTQAMTSDPSLVTPDAAESEDHHVPVA